MITLDHVSFGYESQGATVKDLSFHIDKGEFVALLGANGAGKTTTAKLIDGLLKPTKGKVTILGKDTTKTRVSERARHVGYLFQNPDRQICQNTVREELAFGLKSAYEDMPQEEVDARVDESLKLFSFDGENDPFSLSRGERQLVALASVLVLKPEIMILDEPTTGLDYRECTMIMETITELNKTEGTTVIMVCHDMEVVTNYAKRALVMADGILLADGTVREVFRDQALMEKASLLPPQITDLAIRLGTRFDGADTVEQMADIILEERQKQEGRS